MTSTKTLIIFAHGPAEAVKTHQRYFSGKERKSRMNLRAAKVTREGIPAECEQNGSRKNADECWFVDPS